MPTVKTQKLIALSAPVSITAAETEGEKKGPAKFNATFYTGGALDIQGWDLPVVIDLAGLRRGNVLVANLDHDRTKRVGNFDVVNDGKSLVANGTATAKTAARDEVIGSAQEGYQWQSSLEVNPDKDGVEEVKKGKAVKVNGQSFEGPIYVTRYGTLKGFAFVSHGADDNTSVSIAASAASTKEKVMKPEIKAWAEGMGIDVDNASDEQVATIEANYDGRNSNGKGRKVDASNPFETRKIEAKRRKEIREIADQFMEDRESDEDEIESVEKMLDHAIKSGMASRDFRSDLLESTYPVSRAPLRPKSRDPQLSDRILEAAICQSGRLSNIEDQFSDQELQLAHDKFKGRIGLKQLLVVAAKSHGHQTETFDVDLDIQRAAFTKPNQRPIHGTGFSNISLSNVLAATANKYLFQGWMAVDMTCMKIAKIRSVSNFQQITTVSLIGDLEYLKVGADGEIKHGTLSDLTYTNQIDTYARMLAITRKDIINDDLGAITEVPRRLGRGAALKLNKIFWTEFLGLVAANFFAAGNSNINTGVADATIGGLAATETIFMNQTDPDGQPLALTPKYILVPNALRATMAALLDPQSTMITGASSTMPATNVFRGRFELLSSPYISNSTFTGYTTTGWWMLADPNDLPVIEIAALNGRVEPTVESAEADFHQLGVQYRGYSDVGVNEQEKRAGVYADGGSS